MNISTFLYHKIHKLCQYVIISPPLWKAWTHSEQGEENRAVITYKVDHDKVILLH